MTENKNVQQNTVASASIPLQPWAASFSIDNTTIENYVVNLFVQQTGVSPIGSVLTDENPGKTNGRDLQDSLSLVAFFDYDEFTGGKGNGLAGNLNPAIAQQLPLAQNVEPVDALKPLLSRIGKVIDRKPAKYIVTPKSQGRQPMVKVTFDLHAVLRLILAASPNSFVVAIMSSQSNRTGDQIVLDVTKAIAPNDNNGGGADSDLRDMARAQGRGGSRGFAGNQNQRQHNGGNRRW